MKINLENGICLKIEGELGKFQTLSVDALIKISVSLQELIMSIAKYDLPTDQSVDLNNFKLELSDFKKGSAIPIYSLTPNIQTIINADYKQQRDEVSKKLNNLLVISDKGDYLSLKNIYPEPIIRNEIVDKLYGFTNSFNNSPVLVYEKGTKDIHKESFKIKKFKSSVKKNLIVNIKEAKEEKKTEKAFARIKVTKRGDKVYNKIQEVISTAKHSLSYSPEIINVNNKQYTLNFPLRCLFEKEDDYYIINNEQIDIIGTGLTQDEAEVNFNEEFDYLFNRLNSLDDSKLNKRLKRIKNVLNSFVKQVD